MLNFICKSIDAIDWKVCFAHTHENALQQLPRFQGTGSVCLRDERNCYIASKALEPVLAFGVLPGSPRPTKQSAAQVSTIRDRFLGKWLFRLNDSRCDISGIPRKALI